MYLADVTDFVLRDIKKNSFSAAFHNQASKNIDFHIK